MTSPANANVPASFANHSKNITIPVGDNNFHQQTLPSSNYWSAITYGNGVFCAVSGITSGQNAAATSPDGITWTQRTLPSTTQWSAIAWNGTVFCAVAGLSSYNINTTTSYTNATNIAATSPDGITWTQRTLPTSTYWSAIAWNGSVFCAVAGGGSSIAATSPDGITWTQRTLPISTYWSAIAWNGSVFCAISSYPNMTSTIAATSPDGITWTQRTLPVSTYWSSIAWNGSVFCAVASNGNATNIAATSPDGITWTQRTLPASTYWSSIAWNGSVFCAVAGNIINPNATNIAATSPDGITWTQRTLPANTYWASIISGNGVFCAVSSYATNFATTLQTTSISTILKPIVEVSPANTSATPPLYGGCTVIDLLARNSDTNSHDIQLYRGVVTTTVGTNTGAVTTTGTNTINRGTAGFIADGWRIGDQLVLSAPSTAGSSIAQIASVEGIVCTVTNVTDTALTLYGTPLGNVTITTGYRICKITPHFRSTVPAYSGMNPSYPNYSLLNNILDNSMNRSEIKLTANGILFMAAGSGYGAYPSQAAVTVGATVVYY